MNEQSQSYQQQHVPAEPSQLTALGQRPKPARPEPRAAGPRVALVGEATPRRCARPPASMQDIFSKSMEGWSGLLPRGAGLRRASRDQSGHGGDGSPGGDAGGSSACVQKVCKGHADGCVTQVSGMLKALIPQGALTLPSLVVPKALKITIMLIAIVIAIVIIALIIIAITIAIIIIATIIIAIKGTRPEARAAQGRQAEPEEVRRPERRHREVIIIIMIIYYYYYYIYIYINIISIYV